MEKIYTVTKIQNNPYMGGTEYWDSDTGFLFEKTRKSLNIPELKIGYKIKMTSDNNGFWIKGEIIQRCQFRTTFLGGRMFSWYNKIENTCEKETAYGNWEDFLKATGMTKKQYFARENKLNEELAKKEVNDCIF